MATWKIERRKPACSIPNCGRSFEDGDRHISCLVLEDGEFLRRDICLSCWRGRKAEELLAAAREAERRAREEAERAEAEKPVQRDLPLGEEGAEAAAEARPEAEETGSSEGPAATDGVATDGAATDGVATDGVATDGVATDGVATDGVATGTPVDAPAEKASGAGEAGDEPNRDAGRDFELFWWLTRHEESRKRTVQLDLGSLERLFVQLEGREDRKVRELRYVLCLLLMRKRRVKVEKIVRGADGESFVVKRPRRDERYKVYVYDFDAERMDEVRAQLQAVFDGAEGDAGLPENLFADPPEGTEVEEFDGEDFEGDDLAGVTDDESEAAEATGDGAADEVEPDGARADEDRSADDAADSLEGEAAGAAMEEAADAEPAAAKASGDAG